MVNLMLAFSNMIFATGVAKVLENDKEINVNHILDACTDFTEEKFEAVDPDVVLVDFITLYNEEAFQNSELMSKKKVILIDTNCGRANIVTAILKKNLSGVLLGGSTTDQLKKAIMAVAGGEIWMDKKTLNNLFQGSKAIENNGTAKLSGNEKKVVSLAEQGYTDKETAKKLHISEPKVKTHLGRIFRKLDISNKAQLVTFAVKSQEIHPTLNNGADSN